MRLLIDVGNTCIKWALADAEGELGEARSVRHHGALPVDLHAAWELMEPPSAVHIGCVAGDDLGERLRRICQTYWGLAPAFVETRSQALGVCIAYAEPSRLGVDRWLALVGARHRCAEIPVLIVDAGTAVTFDALAADGRHLGGQILPGIGLMRQVLLARTRIPPASVIDTDVLWGSDTAAAIGAATLQAPAALAVQLFRQLAEQAGREPEMILTGGDGERLLGLMRGQGVDAVSLPDLVLEGLAVATR